MRRLDQYMRLNHITKRWEPLVLLKYQLPYRLTFDRFDTALPLAVPAAGTVAVKNIRVPLNTVAGTSPLGTPFEAQTLMFADSTDTTAAANFTMWLRMFSGRDFSNRPVHVRTIAGTAQLPLMLPEPIFLFANETLGVQFEKISGGAVNVRPYLDGIQYFPDIPAMDSHGFGRPILARLTKWLERKKYIFPYFLTTETVPTIGASATASYEVKIDDMHFECIKLSVVSTGAFGFELSEVTSGESLMNGHITAANGLGNALYPTILPFSYLLPRGSRLKLTFENLTALPNTIYFTAIGRKINAPLKDIQAIKKSTEDIMPSADEPGSLVEETVGVA